MTVPLIILAVLSLVGGFVELPASIGNIHLFSNLVDNTLPAVVAKGEEHHELLFQVTFSYNCSVRNLSCLSNLL